MKRSVNSVGIDRIYRNNAGAALVEFSLLLPILFGMMAMAAEFGNAFHQHHIASKGIHNAARYLARITNEDLCPSQGGSYTTDIENARKLAQTGKFIQGAPSQSDYIVKNWNTNTSFTVAVTCYDNSAETYRGPDTLPIITVSANFPYNGVGMLAAFDRTYFSINVSHDELYIGG